VSTAFIAVLLPALLVLAGLAIDGGQVLVARRETQALADGAARAGGAEIDEAAARSDPSVPIVLDPTQAAAAATAYIAEVAPTAQIVVTQVDPAHIAVRVTSAPVHITLLQLARVGPTVRVQASATAEPRTGITAPGQ
jgi:Flp pilus assembly protein TadG